jgi:hypothetical protein
MQLRSRNATIPDGSPAAPVRELDRGRRSEAE